MRAGDPLLDLFFHKFTCSESTKLVWFPTSILAFPFLTQNVWSLPCPNSLPLRNGLGAIKYILFPTHSPRSSSSILSPITLSIQTIGKSGSFYLLVSPLIILLLCPPLPGPIPLQKAWTFLASSLPASPQAFIHAAARKTFQKFKPDQANHYCCKPFKSSQCTSNPTLSTASLQPLGL